MGDRDWDMEEKRLLEATIRVVQITSGLVLQDPESVQDLNTSSPESGSDIFNYDSPRFQDFSQSEKSCMNSTEQLVPEEEVCTTIIPNDYPKPPPLTDSTKLPVKGIGKIYNITFYFSDGEVKITRFPENTTYNDILMYLRDSKYCREDWTSIYCDVRCREPKMNLGKMRLHQTLSQTKLPDEFSVDVKIKNLFD